MNGQKSNTANRKGQFLWMEPASRNNYLQNLKQKIASDFFYSDQVLSSIVDELAPILEEITFNERLQHHF